jgi:hypothetical protein
MASKLTCMTKSTMSYLFVKMQRNMVRKTTIGVVAGVTEATIPNIVSGGGRGESMGRRVLERIKPLILWHRRSSRRVRMSFTEKSKGSNLWCNYYQR